jgi:hypothetical protein
MADPWAAFDGPAAPPPQAVAPAMATPESGTATAPSGDPWAAFHGPDTTDSGGGLSEAQLAYGKDAYGKPYQSLRNVPANDPVGQSTGTAIRTDQVPGVATQAIGSLPTDPEQKRRVVAGQLFPGMDPAEAQSRMFYGPNGRLAAVGKDGAPFYVDPEPYAPDINQPSSLIPGDVAAHVAGMVGPALPAATGVAAATVTGPTSLVAGPIAAAGGAAVGDVARQSLANYFDPQAGFKYNPAQTLGEAGGAAVGQFVGAGLLRGISPNRLGASSLDIGAVRSGPTLANANRLAGLAEQQGVRLTPGQASGLPSLLAHEDAIASGSAGPGLTDIAATLPTGPQLAEHIPTAIQPERYEIPPPDGKPVARQPEGNCCDSGIPGPDRRPRPNGEGTGRAATAVTQCADAALDRLSGRADHHRDPDNDQAHGAHCPDFPGCRNSREGDRKAHRAERQEHAGEQIAEHPPDHEQGRDGEANQDVHDTLLVAVRVNVGANAVRCAVNAGTDRHHIGRIGISVDWLRHRGHDSCRRHCPLLATFRLHLIEFRDRSSE